MITPDLRCGAFAIVLLFTGDARPPRVVPDMMPTSGHVVTSEAVVDATALRDWICTTETIRKGDTFTAIALRTGGSAADVPAIMALNPSVPDKGLVVGRNITVLPRPAVTPGSDSKPSPASRPSGRYVVFHLRQMHFRPLQLMALTDTKASISAQYRGVGLRFLAVPVGRIVEAVALFANGREAATLPSWIIGSNATELAGWVEDDEPAHWFRHDLKLTSPDGAKLLLTKVKDQKFDKSGRLIAYAGGSRGESDAQLASMSHLLPVIAAAGLLALLSAWRARRRARAA